ncbi:hypothetical protein AXX17_AT2G38880 [Arabidopsis thaliana]|uniref:Transmembrane protein n=1 Tax=Arabidopsis thaliana TaxID=3702 RepID=A0A178VLF5_ARATH|nr:hypothetical protein AXX17_AT2G38880 [Arabidopsis thaliana]
MNSEWEMDSDRKKTFFKCTKWQFEDTLDPINCPFHYFCDSIYAGDYPQITDVLVFFFVTVTYLTTLIVVVRKVISRRRRENDDDGDDDKARRIRCSGHIYFLWSLQVLYMQERAINSGREDCLLPRMV